MAEPRITVVVPSYCPQAAHLHALHASLAAQTLQDFEVVVVDDGSPEANYAPLAGAHYRVLRQPHNRGPAACRNAGAAAARSPLLFFTDTDCTLAPETLAVAHAALARHAIVAGDTRTRIETWFGRLVALLGFPGGGCIGFHRVWRVDADGTAYSFSSCNVAFRRATFEALGREPADAVHAGDLCAIAGIGEVEIGDTIAHPEHRTPLPAIAVEEPTIRMLFAVNDGPFAGQDGEYVTSRQIRDRLLREAKRNVALRVEESEAGDGLVVSGRGILHLGILVENMRREGYEFLVGKPRVIRREIDGATCEPIEQAIVEVPTEHTGKAIEVFGTRRGEMSSLEQRGNTDHVVFRIPSRGLIGLRTRLPTQPQGEAILHHSFHAWEPDKGPIQRRQGGTLVSCESGQATAYALHGLQDRGALFIGPGTPVYEGMIVGEFNKEGDPPVNVVRGRKLTNMRAASADKTIRLAPPRVMSLEESLEYIEDDEFLEVTPKNLRLRKRILSETDRKKAKRRKAEEVL